MPKKGATIRARILGWTVGSESQERPHTRTCGAAGTEKGVAWAQRGRSWAIPRTRPLEIVRQSSRRTGLMPRQRTHHSRITYVFPDDFPHRLERFKEESGLSWAEVARRLGISPLNMGRWKAGMRPNLRHQVALLELADQLDLGHLLTDGDAAWDGRPVREQLRLCEGSQAHRAAPAQEPKGEDGTSVKRRIRDWNARGPHTWAQRGRTPDCIVRPGELNRMLHYGDNWESSI